ncbi:MAG TPA: outer membrane beta-barrel protein [Bryobacteraceae bacterium]|nr:outer membrane beta-barrel protein [Bryobacteraceae bacterium]
MRIAVCILALAVSAFAAHVTTAPPAVSPGDATTDQTQPPNAQTPAPPADTTKPPDATAPAPPAKYGGWVFSGLADGYVDHNSNNPSLGFNQLQNFDLHSGVPRLSLIKGTVDKSDKVLGIHLDIGAGETMRLIHAGDPAALDHQALRYVEQMYLIFKPNNTHGTEIDFGQFVTSAGAEVIESSSNWNYTRSLLFSWAIPYYHFGFRSTIPVTKELTVGFQLTNAWNTVWGNNALDNIAFTLAYTKTKYTYSLNYLEGPNHIGTSQGKRNLVDTTLLLTPNSKLNIYINGDWARDNNAGSGHGQWYGLAGAARYQVTKLFAVAGRGEFFDDTKGYSTGTAQLIKEGTATGEFKLNDHLVSRLEFRHDASDHLFFDQGSGKPLTKGETTITLGIVALLGPLK